MSALVVALAAQATANSWFGKSGAYAYCRNTCLFLNFPRALHIEFRNDS